MVEGMRITGRGNEAEAMVLAALVQRKFDVLIPFGDAHPDDLVVHLDAANFLRVQCKTPWLYRGCMLFNCRATDHRKGSRSYRGLADVFGVYLPPREAVYMVPLNAVADFEGRLRIEPARNNQKQRIRYAADYEIERWSVAALRGLLSPMDSHAAKAIVA
jgi:PD-(D/E)XK endonuclease